MNLMPSNHALYTQTSGAELQEIVHSDPTTYDADLLIMGKTSLLRLAPDPMK
jgi:hypothetical protein